MSSFPYTLFQHGVTYELHVSLLTSIRDYPSLEPVSDHLRRDTLHALCRSFVGFREIHAAVCRAQGHQRPMTPFEVVEEAVRLMRAGRLGFYVRRAKPVPKEYLPPPAKPAASPDSTAEPTDWIEVEVVDPDGNPVPHVRFKLVLPNGRTRTGSVDEHGLARVEGIGSGSCEVQLVADEKIWRQA